VGGKATSRDRTGAVGSGAMGRARSGQQQQRRSPVDVEVTTAGAVATVQVAAPGICVTG
jgi:hypothetical protein